MIKRLGYSSVEITDERSGCSYDVEVVITQMCLDDLMFKIKFVSCVPRSCSRSHTKII